MNIYSTILLVTTVTILALAVYSLRFRHSPGAIFYFLLLIGISIYAFGYAMELLSGQIPVILLWLRIEYIGISFLPSLVILLALSYCGKTRYLRTWFIYLLILYGLITYAVQYTNFRNLFYLDYSLITYGDLQLANFTHGTWYWIHQVMANCMLLISSILYLTMVMESSGINRIRAVIMLISSVIPWTVYLIYITGHSPRNIDLSPFSFAMVGFLGALGVLRFRLLEYVPIAMEDVFTSMASAVIVLDIQGRLSSYNLSAARLYPQLKPSLKGESLDTAKLGLPSFSGLRDGFETDISFPGPGGNTHHHVFTMPIYNNRRKRMGLAITITDVTEKIRKKNRLVEKEKQLKELNANKDKFLAVIGHDLRNSFHLIINMTELLVSNLEKNNPDAALKKGKIIFDTSVNTYHLLQNLLEWALIQQNGLHFNPVDTGIHELIGEEIRNLRTLYEQKELSIDHTVSSAGRIKGDVEMLKMIIRNLLSNAIKYSFPGGEIRISATDGKDDVTVEIADNGTGMTAEEQDLVLRGEGNLTKRGTAAESGTGLGLRLCLEFIQLHHGKLWVNSTPGKGSTFSFSIPKTH